MSNFEIISLDKVSEDELYACHVRAFKNYPFQWTRKALFKTLKRRGYEPSLSFGAFYNGELVSFTLNGIGEFMGVKSAYDTGTGTVEEHRGKGLATAIFEHSLPFLLQEDIKQYILEVLIENRQAYSLYKQQGFIITRALDCFITPLDKWRFVPLRRNTDVQIKPFKLEHIRSFKDSFDFELSWQNSFQSIFRQPKSFKAIGAYHEDKLVGFGVIEPSSGDIPILFVDKDHRVQGIGTRLLWELSVLNKADILKIVNIEMEQMHITQFVKTSGIPRVARQFEMIKNIEAPIPMSSNP